MKPGRNDPCHCGSGKKYKKCCYAKDSAKSEDAVVTAAEAEETGAAQGADRAEATQSDVSATKASSADAGASDKAGKKGFTGKKGAPHLHGKGGTHPLSPRVFRGAQRGN